MSPMHANSFLLFVIIVSLVGAYICNLSPTGE
jgi:hypothetical protein